MIKKIWGQTTSVFEKNNVEIHRIQVNKNACCSRHLHQHKNNIFYVETGKLLIQQWQDETLTETILLPGQTLEIDHGKLHRFIGLENSVAFEIYYVSLNEHDIIREDSGSDEIGNII